MAPPQESREERQREAAEWCQEAGILFDFESEDGDWREFAVAVLSATSIEP